LRLHRRLQTAADALTCCVVVGSVLAFGAVHVPVMVVCGAVLCAVAIFHLARGAALPAPAVVCALAAAFTALQATPLPTAWVHALSPHAARFWSSAQIAGGEPAFASLSVSPAATSVEALKWLMYAAAFVAGRAMATRRGERSVVALQLFSAVALAATTLTHGVFGLKRVYGFFEPSFETSTWLVGPLLNSNNLASYLNLGAFCGFGLLRSREPPPLGRAVVAVCIMVLLGQTLICGSRGALLTFVVLGGLYVVVELRLRQSRGAELGSAPVLAGILLGGCVLGGLAYSERAGQTLLSSDVSKLETFGWTTRMIRDFPVGGVGRGAFEAVSAAYRTSPGAFLFGHPENFVLQFLSEWGLAAGPALLVAFAVALRPSRLKEGSAVRGAYFGALAVVVQNLFDLGLELASVSIGLAVLLGACLGGRTELRGRRPTWFVAALGLLAVAGLLAGIRGGPDPVSARQGLHDQFVQVIERKLGSPERLDATVRAAIARSPAAAYPFTIGAAAALERRQPALPWINRALERDPLNGRVHVLAARAVHAASGPLIQALSHLKYAAAYEPQLAPTTSQLAVRWTREPEQLLLAAPAGPNGGRVLQAMAGQLPRDGSPLRIGLLREAIARAPAQSSAAQALAEDLLWLLATGSGACASEAEACRREVATLATRLREYAPHGAAWVLIHARLLASQEKWAEADRYLVENCPRVEPRAECSTERLETAARVGDARALEAAIASLRAECGGAIACASAEGAIARRYLSLGWRREALGPLRRAAELSPSARAWLDVARLAHEFGLRGEARRSLQQVLLLQPDGGPLAKEAREIEADLRSRAN
jgi:tetratricopeptide (TPR) repeat protein